jgi:putative hydrolase of the HAD superfamily
MVAHAMAQPTSSHALLVDFGGVLTTSPFDAFAAFCAAEGLAPDALRAAFGTPEGSRLLVDCETGVLPEPAFEEGLARLLSRDRPAPLDPAGLLARVNAGLAPDRAMVALVQRVRAAGITTVLVSNSLGRAAYDWCDFPALFDHTVISGDLGARKPSRRVYRHAAELAGVPAERCTMVDDLEHNLVGARRAGLRTVLHVDAATTTVALEQELGLVLEVAA